MSFSDCYEVRLEQNLKLWEKDATGHKPFLDEINIIVLNIKKRLWFLLQD